MSNTNKPTEKGGKIQFAEGQIKAGISGLYGRWD